MATASWANFYDMTSDAGFRTIGSNFHSQLAAVNNTILTFTADTGQINWTTVTKPTVANTVAGYEILQYADSQGTFYFKFEYGTGTTASIFSMWITVGTGSNGSGTITGIIGTRRQVMVNQPYTSTVTNYTSHMCVLNGLFWFVLGEGSNTSGSSHNSADFMVWYRTCDSTGAVDNTGFCMITPAGGTGALNIIVYNISGSVTRVDLGVASVFKGCLDPFDLASTDFGTGGNHNYQVFRHQLPMTPEIKTTAFVASYVVAEAPTASTTTLAVVGSTTHTFMFFNSNIVNTVAVVNAGVGLCMVYE